MGIRNRDYCREYFRKLKILPLQCQYILSLSLFAIYNKHFLKLNTEIHNINTITKSNLHQPLPTKKEHIFSELVCSVFTNTDKGFVLQCKNVYIDLKNYVYFNSWHSLEECSNYSKNQSP